MKKVILAALLFVGSIVPAMAQAVITGRVVGANGRPMALANVYVMAPNDSSVVESADISAGSEFKMDAPSKGIWILRFTGVHHHFHDVAIYLDKRQSIRLTVRLRAYHYEDNFDRVQVVGNFNNWHVLTAVPMKKMSDGTFLAEIKTDVNPVEYRLRYVRKWAEVEGQQADRFVRNGTEGYNSVIEAKNGIVRIIFDPRKLFRSDEPAGATFGNSDCVVSGFARIYDELQKYKEQFSSAQIEYMAGRGHNIRDFNYDWSSALKSIKREISKEKNRLLKEELYLCYNTIGIMSKQTDASFYREVLKGIPAASPVWLLNPHSMFHAINRSNLTDSQKDRYVSDVLNRNPYSRVEAAILMDEFMAAKLAGDNRKARRYYRTLVTEYGQTEEARKVRKDFPDELRLEVGKPVPGFSVTSLENSARIISNRTLLGKYYLMFFWISTNKLCIEEIRALKRVYGKFKERNFEILSLSLDRKYQTAEKVLRGEDRMPWLNAFLGVYLESKIASRFEVVTVPTLFLVGPDGELLAQGDDLLGTNLEKTLEKYIPGTAGKSR